jgi:hypothetical protein
MPMLMLRAVSLWPTLSCLRAAFSWKAITLVERTEKLIAAAVQWAEAIVWNIDSMFPQ